MLAHIKNILKDAQKGGYAVGAFNVHNLETVLGVANAAVKAKSPAIIQVSEGAIEYMGIKPITHIVSTVAKNVATPVPIALHLDHGRSFDSVFECINAGFSSVHIDASHLPMDENISLSKQVVDMAHRKRVWVQGEVGAIVGGHGKTGGRLVIPLADPKDVIKFVKKTGVDTIAAAVGTAHGIYKSQDIKLNLIEEIIAGTGAHFVLHGGSGNKQAQIKSAIKAGVRVINIGSDIKIAFSTTLINNCINNKEERDPRNLLRPTIKAVEEVVLGKMKLFGSAGQCDIGDVET